jgi:hypothetical protein
MQNTADISNTIVAAGELSRKKLMYTPKKEQLKAMLVAI